MQKSCLNLVKNYLKAVILFIMPLNLYSQANYFAGSDAGDNNDGQANTFVGHNTGRNHVNGDKNSFFGFFSGFNNQGELNSFFGAHSGEFALAGNQNSFFGFLSGRMNLADDNSFYGALSGMNNMQGNGNSFFGSYAGRDNTTGSNNVFIGLRAGLNNTSGTANSFLGKYAGRNNTEGGGNSFFGADAGDRNTTGSDNSFFGSRSGHLNTSGYGNSFFGHEAGFENRDAWWNSFFGAESGLNTRTGGSNSFFGSFSGYNNDSGAANTFIGASAGRRNSIGNHNVYVGASAGYRSSGSENVFVGYRAGYEERNSARLHIANNSDRTLIYGEFDNDRVGIGTTSPTEALQVNGAIRIGGSENEERGTIRWTGNDFEGRKGLSWVSLTRSDKLDLKDSVTEIGDRKDPISLSWVSERGALRMNASIFNEQPAPELIASMGLGSLASGRNSRAQGAYSVAMGDQVVSQSYSSVVVGRFNEIGNYDPNRSVAQDPIFVVGNGTSENARRNAMIILKNGNVGIGETNLVHRLNVGGSLGINSLINYNEGQASIGFTGNNNIVMSTEGEARFFIKANGKVGIGEDDPNELLEVNGSIGIADYLSHKGDEGTQVGFFGNDIIKLRTSDIDRLTVIHDGKVGIGTSTPLERLDTRGNIAANSFIERSDVRFKENIEELGNGLSLLQQLRSVRYTYRQEAYPEYHFDDKVHIGFLANEVQEVLPELVYEGEGGLLQMNYNGLIPVIIRAAQEMSGSIVDLEEENSSMQDQLRHLEAQGQEYQDQINELSRGIESLSSENQILKEQMSQLLYRVEKLEEQIVNNKFSRASLDQNYPNPFNQNSKISYYLPEDVVNAQLCIFDMNGQRKRSFDLVGSGHGEVLVQGGSLEAGVYIYSLIVNGKETDSKRMILLR